MNSAGRQSSTGFSLIEMSIVIALIGILTALAIPAWQEHLLRARRSAAQSALATIEARQARYLLQHRRYAQSDQLFTDFPAGLGIDATLSQFYSLEILPDASGYIASATIRDNGPQRRDARCYRLSIDGAGRRTAISRDSVVSTEVCWQ